MSVDDWKSGFGVLTALLMGLSAPGVAQQADPMPPTERANRVILVTGSTGGLGREVAADSRLTART